MMMYMPHRTIYDRSVTRPCSGKLNGCGLLCEEPFSERTLLR
jgi:hypothetical protein